MQCSEIERLHPAGGNSLNSVSGDNKAQQNRTHLNKSTIKVPENKILFFSSLLTAGNILKGGGATSITASVPIFCKVFYSDFIMQITGRLEKIPSSVAKIWIKVLLVLRILCLNVFSRTLVSCCRRVNNNILYSVSITSISAGSAL